MALKVGFLGFELWAQGWFYNKSGKATFQSGGITDPKDFSGVAAFILVFFLIKMRGHTIDETTRTIHKILWIFLKSLKITTGQEGSQSYQL